MDGVEIVVCEASGEASFGGSRRYLSNREKVSRFSGVITSMRPHGHRHITTTQIYVKVEDKVLRKTLANM